MTRRNVLISYSNGQLHRIDSGVTRQDLESMLVKGLSPDEHPAHLVSNDSAPANEAQTQMDSAASSSDRGVERAEAPPQTTEAPANTLETRTETSQPSQVQDLFSDRRAAQEARQQAERAQLAERARIRRQEQEAAAASANASSAKQLPRNKSYAAEQVQKKKEAASELQRIRRQVEYDKQERRERAQSRRAAAADTLAQPHSVTDTTAPNRPMEGSTRLQVRLLDGSAIRWSFTPSTTISELRQWIDRDRTDGNHPYTLKQLMTPAPSRTISDEAAKISLGELGLHPSATLIMSPVEGLAAAYQQSPSGAAQTIMALIWSYIVMFFTKLVDSMKTFLGLNQHRQQSADSEGTSDPRAKQPEKGNASQTSGSAAQTETSGIRIRTLRDQQGGSAKGKDREDPPSEHQLYNGGGVSDHPVLVSDMRTLADGITAEFRAETET